MNQTADPVTATTEAQPSAPTVIPKRIDGRTRAGRFAKAETSRAEAFPPDPAPIVPTASEETGVRAVQSVPIIPRKPFGALESKLAFPARPGYRRRIFNDSPGRIARAIEAGYEHVMDAMGRPVSRIVDKGGDGKGMSGFLMEIPMEYYNEDFARKHASLDEVDKAIYRGKFKDEETNADGRYVPSTGIKVTVQRGDK